MKWHPEKKMGAEQVEKMHRDEICRSIFLELAREGRIWISGEIYI
ncbi:MAG: hypothetical protein ACYDHX_12765 [Methanothrix sp.]